MSQGKQQPQHQPAGGPAFWNITHNLKPGELESDMIKMLYSTGIDLQKENEALKQRIKQLEEDLGDAYAEMMKQWPVITAVFDRSVWLKAREAKP